MADIKGKVPPPLPLEMSKEEMGDKKLTFKLLSNPQDPDSAKISKTVRIIDGSEELRTIIQWKIDTKTVCAGLNLATGPTINGILEQLMTGSASTTYLTNMAQLQVAEFDLQRQAAREAALVADPNASETDLQAAENLVVLPPFTTQMVSDSINKVIAFVSPHKVLEKQKRFMRRQCRKPKDMKTRVFVNHLTRINWQEIVHLPPRYDVTQCLPEDELIDIVVNAIPRKWIREMDRLDFDPAKKTMLEVIAFCERQEAAEEHEKADDKKVVSQKGKANDHGNSKKQKTTEGGGKKDRDCLYHGPNTHPSSSCKVLKSLVDSTKKSRTITTTTNDGKNSKFKSNTWNRKAEEAKATTKKELNAYVKKVIEKQLKASIKKRPKKDDDDKSLNAIDITNVESEDETGLGKLTLSSDSDSDTSE